MQTQFGRCAIASAGRVWKLAYAALLLSTLFSFAFSWGSSSNGGHEKSLNAYVPAQHKAAFDRLNLLVFGDLNLMKSAVKGRVAVTGSAQLEEFDFASERKCQPETPSLTVVGTLSARMGSINNGFAVAGRGSEINHSVRMNCAKRVESYDPTHLKITPYKEMYEGLLKEAGDLCINQASGTVESGNGTMRFIPHDNQYSCYSVFNVETDDLRFINEWVYAGKNYYRNLIINVMGKHAVFKNFKMTGFNARRTLILFCSTYGKFEFFNARMHGSILSPTTSFTVMDTVFNGSLITGSMRGSVAVLKAEYVTC